MNPSAAFDKIYFIDFLHQSLKRGSRCMMRMKHDVCTLITVYLVL